MSPIIPAPNDIPGDNDEAGNVPAGFPDESGMVVALSDSESDNESIDHDGYEPLSQDPFSPFNDVSDEEEYSSSDADEPMAAAAVNEINGVRIISPDEPPRLVLQDEIDESTYQTRTITMTQEHAETIKSVMRDVTIPMSNVPEWAKYVPEKEWKVKITTYMTKPKSHYTIVQGHKKYSGPSVVDSSASRDFFR